MSTEENKRIVGRFWNEVVSGHNMALAGELFATDYQHHDPGLPPEVQGSLAAYTQHFATFFDAFSDLRVEVDDMLAEGERVSSRTRWLGTNDGSLMGMPATGRAVDVSLFCIHRLQDGKIAEGWVVFDVMGMMQQLGAIPQPQAASA